MKKEGDDRSEITWQDERVIAEWGIFLCDEWPLFTRKVTFSEPLGFREGDTLEVNLATGERRIKKENRDANDNS